MRRDLLRELDAHPHWAGLDADLMHLFKSWFNAGFLVLSRIDWHTSAVVLERLIQYEAVHQIQGWHDLHRRLEADRCCFAFFHPALVDEPLIFIEVALTSGMSARVQPLLDPQVAHPRSRPRQCRDVLFDHQLSGGPARGVFRQFPDQESDRAAGEGIPAVENVRDDLTSARIL